MKLASFEQGGWRAGAVIGDMILDVASAHPGIPASIEEILRRGLLPEVQNLVDNASEIDRPHFHPLK